MGTLSCAYDVRRLPVLDELDLAVEAASIAEAIVQHIHISGRVEYLAHLDKYLIDPEVLAHAIACAMITWHYRGSIKK